MAATSTERKELAEASRDLLGIAPALKAAQAAFAASSIPQLKTWISADPEMLGQLLQLRLLSEPTALLAALYATNLCGPLTAMSGDAIDWFAHRAGFGLKETHKYAKVAAWLYEPRKFPLPPNLQQTNPAARTAEARRRQRDMRALFATQRVSLCAIAMCVHQVGFLSAPVRHHGPGIIANAIAELGANPNPQRLLGLVQFQVSKLNRAAKTPAPEATHSYVRYSRLDANGMMLIQALCNRTEGSVIRRALRNFRRSHPGVIDPALPAANAECQALFQLCAQELRLHTASDSEVAASGKHTAADVTAAEGQAPTGSANGVQYRVNVVMTLDEFTRAQEAADPRAVRVRTDSGDTVAWQMLQQERLNPLDAVTIVGQNGVELRELPGARFFSPEQRDWQLAFQVFCAHPGCRVPARDCEAHHIVPVARGGTTTTDNLVLVCRAHHAMNDDSHRKPGRFHYAKDARGIPFLQAHADSGADSRRLHPPRFNELNLRFAPVLRIRR